MTGVLGLRAEQDQFGVAVDADAVAGRAVEDVAPRSEASKPRLRGSSFTTR